MKYIAIILILGLITKFYDPVKALIEMTNIQCIPLDPSFATFEYCYIKPINRSYTYFSLKVNLHKVPINNVTITVAVMKKANGYKPFLYNITIDGCKFLRNRKAHKLANFFYEFIEQFTNMNHTCPYKDALIVEKLDISFVDNRLFSLLPMPEGEYGIFTIWTAYNIPRAYVNGYGRVSIREARGKNKKIKG